MCISGDMNMHAVRHIWWWILLCFLTTSDGSSYEDQDLDPCKEVRKPRSRQGLKK
jgi:hypothetical protein